MPTNLNYYWFLLKLFLKKPDANKLKLLLVFAQAFFQKAW
jgi:hypothetical protein